MGATERVLIVEDELHALAGLAELVSGWGYRTETARDGIEGLEKVTEWFPGIIVTDLKMPRMDGLEMLSRLSEMHRARGRGHEDGRLRLHSKAY
jgi:CheY-like chemotaxis protein